VREQRESKSAIVRKYFPSNVAGRTKKILELVADQKMKITDERTDSYDSPTGRVYIGVAKKPLMKVRNGFGYQGILLQTDNRMFIQCHVCGLWFRILSKLHLATHKMNQKQYKKKFGLFSTKALVSDDLSYSLEERAYKRNEVSPNSEKHLSTARAKAMTAKRGKHQLLSKNTEWNNRHGLCEKQLGFRLLEYIKTYKSLPSRGQKGEGRSIAKALHRRYDSLNLGFKHYKVPQIFRQGTNVELLAPNNKQIFYNYNKGYDREVVYQWILKNTPYLRTPNRFADQDEPVSA